MATLRTAQPPTCPSALRGFAHLAPRALSSTMSRLVTVMAAILCAVGAAATTCPPDLAFCGSEGATVADCGNNAVAQSCSLLCGLCSLSPTPAPQATVLPVSLAVHKTPVPMRATQSSVPARPYPRFTPSSVFLMHLPGIAQQLFSHANRFSLALGFASFSKRASSRKPEL